jgi:hypothetical protein
MPTRYVAGGSDVSSIELLGCRSAVCEHGRPAQGGRILGAPLRVYDVAGVCIRGGNDLDRVGSAAKATAWLLDNGGTRRAGPLQSSLLLLGVSPERLAQF